MSRPRVFVASHDPAHLLFLCRALETASYAVEAFSDPQALIARLMELGRTDRACVVLDVTTPELDGLTAQTVLVERGIGVPVIFVGLADDARTAVTAMKRGAVDFLMRPVDAGVLCAGVASALRRGSAAIAKHAVRALARSRWAALSHREQRVSILFARGMLTKQIAAELGITVSTVHFHRAKALSKLQVNTAVEVARLMSSAAVDLGDAEDSFAPLSSRASYAARSMPAS